MKSPIWAGAALLAVFLGLFASSSDSQAVPSDAATEIQEAYIGVVSPGKGNGMLGHAFLLFKKSNEVFFSGSVYQYNVSLSNGGAIGNGPLNLSSLIFSLKKSSFIDIYADYTKIEDRSILLYGLKLSQPEISKLRDTFDRELANPPPVSAMHYGLSNNCVTKTIDAINAVVDDSRKIELYGEESLIYSTVRGLRKTISEPILSRFPFYLSKMLENHPVSSGRTKTFPRQTVTRAKFVIALDDEVDAMTTECHWSAETKEVYRNYLLLYLADPKKYPLDPLDQLASSCKAALKNHYHVLLLLYQVIPPAFSDEKTHVYKRVEAIRSEMTR